MTITRRELLKLGVATGLMTVAAGGTPLWANTGTLITTTIPSTGEKLPAVGIGTRDYRSNRNSEEVERFRQTLQAFHAGGGRVVDTSPNYGNAENVVSDLLRELGIREQMFMATKVDRENQADGRVRMEESFEALGGEQIDLMQVHNLRGTEVELETMKAWKQEGRFSYLGITTHRAGQYEEMEAVMRKHELDFVQLNYSLADRGAEKRLLPLALDRGMAVLVNLPFARGQLFKAVAGKPLPDWATEMDAESWGQVFLKYIISSPTQTLPIPGTSKPHHAADNMGAMAGPLPDKNLRTEIEKFVDPLL